MHNFDHCRQGKLCHVIYCYNIDFISGNMYLISNAIKYIQTPM